VLAALAAGESMTAGQVADKAGLPRGTVSTTLSRLAKTGEVQKADRGYRLALASPSAQSTGAPAAAGAVAHPTEAADAVPPEAPPTAAAEANGGETADSTGR
jgi:DNA-binding IclR family transcriptional regulator